MTEKKISLSPSKLSVLVECPRCFWLACNKKIAKPRGAFPSLPGGIDRVLKKYFDAYRAKGEFPPEFQDKLPGSPYPDQAKLNRMRNWRTFKYFNEELNAELYGALDDLIIDEVGQIAFDNGNGTAEGGGTKCIHIPLDYKTKASYPPTDGREYYGNQLDAYELLLHENGLTPAGYGMLAYVYPAELPGPSGEVEVRGNVPLKFNIAPFELETSKERAMNLFKRGVEILRGPIPAADPTCKTCTFVKEHTGAVAIQKSEVKA